jgi:TonB family protein
LRDQSISAVYELSEHDGLPFAAMQSLEGETLMQAIGARRSLALLQKALMMSQVARGIDILHSAGIWVGIRPSGIVLGAEGSATIQDFGSVRPLPGDEAELANYRSPEENAGASPDRVSDIYSLGAIYYEFLTDQPFSRRPDRIRDIVPDCPEPLENLILRALERRRELRYQCLAELQGDAEPIIRELSRIHAAAALPSIRELVEAGELEKADGGLFDLLRIDPGNRAANRLRAEIRTHLHRKTIAPRIASLFAEAEEAASNGQFESAVELLRSGLRLDTANAEAKSRMVAMETRLEQARRCAAQVREARTLFDDGHLTQARARLLDAIQTDPAGREAPELLELVVEAIARRQAEERIQREVRAADGQMEAREFERAIRTLETLQSDFPDSPLVAQRLAHAREEKIHADRLTRLKTDLSAARRFLKNEQFDEAVAVLEPRAREFPEDREVVDLLSLAADALQRSRETAARVAVVLDEARLLVDSNRPDLALQFLRESLAGLPDQPQIASEVSAIEAMLPAWNARRFVSDVLARAAALDQLQGAGVALSVVEEALQSYPASGELSKAAGQLRDRVRCQERQKRLSRRLEAIRRRIDSQAWPQALALLEPARAEFPEETEFDTLLRLVEEGIRRSECERAVADARQLLGDGETEQAEHAIQEALERLGDSPLFAAVREELAARRKDDEDWTAAQVLFGRCRFEEAELILTRLAERNRPEVLALLATVREARAVSAEAQLYENGRDKALKLIQQEEFGQAADLLRNLLSLFPDDPILERQLASAQAGLDSKNGRALPVESEKAPGTPHVTPPVQVKKASALRDGWVARFAGAARTRGRLAAAVLLLTAGGGTLLWRLTVRQTGLPSSPSQAPGPPASTAAKSMSPVGGGAPVETRSVDSASSSAVAAQAMDVRAPSQFKPARPFVAQSIPPAASPTPAPDLPPAADLRLTPGVTPGLPANLPAPPLASAPIQPSSQTVTSPTPPPRVGGRVTPAKGVRTPPPRMPQLAIQRGIRGDVEVELTVSKEGAVTNVRTIAGDPILVQAAKAALLEWRYEPATLNGQPTESAAKVHIVFGAKR